MLRRLFLTVAVIGTAALGQDITTKLDAHMKGLEAANAFSGSVLVAQKGKVLLAQGYGMANYELDVPNRPATKFRIGSVTKQFTATAILQLQERGKLSVEDSICKWIENCPETWRTITIHHLLSHTSGIPNFTSFADYGKTQSLPATLTSIIDRFRSRPLVFQPAERWAYSNSNYTLLGAVVEKASGKPYADYVAANIFEPLKMAGTGYDDTRKIIKDRAAGYARRLTNFTNAAYIDMSVPHAAGALYSTVEDLYKWDRSLYTEAVLKKPSLDRMFTVVKNNYAYGWFVDESFGRKRIWHGGGINGFAAMIIRYPADDVVVIALSNIETTNSLKTAQALAALVFGVEPPK